MATGHPRSRKVKEEPRDLGLSIFPEAIEDADPLPTPPPGQRWTADRGAMFGEPSLFLDGETGDDAKAAIIEHENEQGKVLYEAVLKGGQMIAVADNVGEAAAKAEKYVDKHIPVRKTSKQIKPKTHKGKLSAHSRKSSHVGLGGVR